MHALERVPGKLGQIQGGQKEVIRVLAGRKVRAFQGRHGGAKMEGNSIIYFWKTVECSVSQNGSPTTNAAVSDVKGE